MRIMTAGTVHYHPFTGPINHAFAVCSAQPVPLGTKMALAAQLITVIKINLLSFHIHQKIPVLTVMTFYTRKFILTLAMIDLYGAMGNESSVPGLSFFPGMADAALVAAYGILAGQNLECPSLVRLFCHYRLNRQLMD